MQAIQLSVSGPWGHFRRPETNRTPLTHDFMTKTALIGMMGAVLGIERDRDATALSAAVRRLDVWSKAVEPRSERRRTVSSSESKRETSMTLLTTRRRYEFLRDPHFQIAIALAERPVGVLLRSVSRRCQGAAGNVPPGAWLAQLSSESRTAVERDVFGCPAR